MATDDRRSTAPLSEVDAEDEGRGTLPDARPFASSRPSSAPPRTSFEEDKQRLAPLLQSAPHTAFFSLVASLERALGASETLGTDAPPSAEKIRFRHDPSLGFSAGDISHAVARREIDPEGNEPERTVVDVTTTFLGLTGGISPMPLYLAEEVAQEEESDRVRGDFLDVFHHRAVSLFYRLARHYSITEAHEHVDADPWSRRALALAGADFYGESKSPIPMVHWLRLAPFLVGRERGRHVLEAALAEVLGDELPGVAIRVVERAGGMVDLAVDERCMLSASGRPKSNVLGKSAVLGGRVRDSAGRFRVAIGPLDESQYPRLLAEGDLVPIVRELVDTFVPAPLEWDLELKVGAARTPFKLTASPGRRGPEDRAASLGRATWLGAPKAERTVRVGSLSNPLAKASPTP